MNTIVNWIEALPLPLLEGWGTFAYIVGFALAIAAYGGFTFRPGGRWGFGRERQAWDSKAFLSMPLTFVLIIAAGYLGSFVVLVPGAQTFESLKDLVVFLCIVLFGYPALLMVPFAYGLSDLIEGVPPDYVLGWLPGYFINPACFWIAYQLFGKNPDFKRTRTWGKYLVFVGLFLSIEPVLWGYICSGKFTPAISYRSITSALFFTTGITWLMAPFAMLAAFPLARRFGLFWAGIPGHVKERLISGREWIWEAGGEHVTTERAGVSEGWPLRVVIVTPFIALILILVGATAYVTLKNAQEDATKLAVRLQQEISQNIDLKLDEYLANLPGGEPADRGGIDRMLGSLPGSRNGLVLVVDRSGNTIGSSADEGNAVSARAVEHLKALIASNADISEGAQFSFDIVTEKPLSRATWLAWASAYQDRRGGHADWVALSVMPESYYLAGIQAGNSNSALVFSIALLLSIITAAFLAALVTRRLRVISQGTRNLARGDLTQRVPGSRMEELNSLAKSFNDMAARLMGSFDEIREEVVLRKQKEAQFRDLLESAPDAMIIADRDGIIILVNSQAEKLFGYDRVELIGQSIEKLIPERFRGGHPFHRKSYSEAPESRPMGAGLELPGRRKDGSEFPVEISLSPLETEQGSVVSASIRDITERKKAETNLRVSENRLQLAVRAANLAVWEWDIEKNELKWEDSMFLLYDVDKSAFDGSVEFWTNLVIAEDRERALEDVQSAVRGDREFDTQFRIGRSDGSVRFIKGVGRTVRDERGQPLRMVGLNWDITEQLLADHELRRHRDNLEDLVTDRTEALSVAVGQARAASVAKTDFLANMSHEIRTPMNIVLGYAQMLLRDSSLNAQQLRKIEAIHSSGNHLLTLINDILEMSKIEAGRTTLMTQPFELSGLFDQVELMFTEIAGSKGIELVFQRDAGLARVIEGDEGKVRQVVINLLSNATKFTDRGRVSVRAFYSPAGSGRSKVMITVKDTGIGIETGDLNRIFDAFDQSGAGLIKAGTGLGLAISRNFARLMGGDLTVASVLGEGSTFTFSFEAGVADPSSVLEEETGPAAFVSRDASAMRKVLIVDDVAASRGLLHELLTEAGYEVRMAESGEEALEIAGEWAPELVLMDLRMPGIGGLEAIRALRAGGSKTRIIAVTANALPDAQLEAFQMGADNFLRKPFQEAELFKKIDELSGRRGDDSAGPHPNARPPADSVTDARELARLLGELPAELRGELREAAIGARAGRIAQIAELADKHSEKAAARIKALAENFDYDRLLAATEQNK